MKKLLLVLGLALVSHGAFAACPTTSITVKDGGGSSQTFCIGGSAGQLLNQTQIVDPSGANVALALDATLTTTNTDLGPPGATACATDTGSCSLNALLQRLAQRLTTINTTLAAPFQAGGSIGNTSFASTQSGNWSVRTQDGSGNAITSTGSALDVNVKSGGTVGQGSTSSGQGGSLVMGAATSSAPSYTTGQTDPLSLTLSGDLRVFASNTAFAPAAATTGGASNYHVIAAASDNHANIKNGAGTLYDIDCTSSSDGTATDYVRLYDAGSGFNGCNSATNIIWGMVCPAPVTAAGIGGGFARTFPVGRVFSTGLSICITGNGTPSDTGTTNGHTTTVVNVGYK